MIEKGNNQIRRHHFLVSCHLYVQNGVKKKACKNTKPSKSKD